MHDKVERRKINIGSLDLFTWDFQLLDYLWKQIASGDLRTFHEFCVCRVFYEFIFIWGSLNRFKVIISNYVLFKNT